MFNIVSYDQGARLEFRAALWDSVVISHTR